MMCKNTIGGLEGSVSFDKKSFSVHGSVATIHSQLATSGLVYDSPYDLDYFFRFWAKIKLTNAFEINARWNHRQGSTYSPVIKSELDPQTNTYLPYYAGLNQQSRLPDYRLLDLNISKYWALPGGVCIGYLSANNLLNIRNTRAITYNFTYEEAIEQFFTGRVIFGGIVFQWN